MAILSGAKYNMKDTLTRSLCPWSLHCVERCRCKLSILQLLEAAIHTTSTDNKLWPVRLSLGTDVYPHMPILRPHAAWTGMGSHKSPEASHYNKGVLADSSDFGLLGEQNSPKCEIPCPGRR